MTAYIVIALVLAGLYYWLWRSRQPADEIVQSIYDEPHRWVASDHTINRDDGISVWTSNGFLSAGMYRPHKTWFGVEGCRRFRQAYRWHSAWRIVNETPADLEGE